MITGLHHAQITIPRGAEEAGRAFYVGLLGLHEIPKPESLVARGGFWLAAGDGCVHVGVEDDVDRSKTKAHLAYRVSGIDVWRRRLGEAGMEIRDGVPVPGCERFEFRDPFGNRIEMVEPLGEA